MDDDDQPQKSGEPTEDWHFVEIPTKFSAIRDADLDLAIKWKLAVRETLKPAFEAGYWAVDFMRRDGRNWYVLQRTD